MIVNNTRATIILPSRHRLRPGTNDHIPDSVLTQRANRAFAERLISNKKLTVGYEPPRPIGAPKIATTPNELPNKPLSRYDLAAAKDEQIHMWAKNHLMEDKMSIDDKRASLALIYFGP